MERKRIFAISGVKNSGKTTLICRLLEIFKDKGLKVAVLRHDGHDFVPDVPGTDTYCQLQSGAYGTAVFSAGKYMLVKQQPQISEKELAEFFPEADLIYWKDLNAVLIRKLKLSVREIRQKVSAIRKN